MKTAYTAMLCAACGVLSAAGPVGAGTEKAPSGAWDEAMIVGTTPGGRMFYEPRRLQGQQL